jgi:hypothetical protein
MLKQQISDLIYKLTFQLFKIYLKVVNINWQFLSNQLISKHIYHDFPFNQLKKLIFFLKFYNISVKENDHFHTNQKLSNY